MTWTAPEVDLPEGPLTGAERPILEGYLAWHRAYLLHKCAGLTGEQLAHALGAAVQPVAAGPGPAHGQGGATLVPGAARPARTSSRCSTPARASTPTSRTSTRHGAGRYERFLEECRLADEVVAAASYDEIVPVRQGEMSLFAVVVHMVEEYAQHNGHADLLREAIDGSTDK